LEGLEGIRRAGDIKATVREGAALADYYCAFSSLIHLA